MTIRVIREPSINGTTFGVVFVDDRFFSFSLEDQIRERSGQPVARWKVPGQTAIPSGRYRVVYTRSQRFGRLLPELLDVPGFSGVRLHSGNVASETDGCLLLGAQRDGVRLSESRKACEQFNLALQAAVTRGESAWVLVENPLGWSA